MRGTIGCTRAGRIARAHALRLALLTSMSVALSSVPPASAESLPVVVPAEVAPVAALNPDTPRDITLETLADPGARASLEQPGDVVFADDFEAIADAPGGATDASTTTLGRYFEVRGLRAGRARVVDDPELAHSGRRALQLTSSAEAGGVGAGVNAWLAGAHPRLHLRYYLKYADDYDAGARNHTGGALAGVAGGDRWRGMGTAGRRPRGDDYYLVTLETGMRASRVPPGTSQVYAYWPGMRPDGRGDFWGNVLAPATRRAPERGRWTAHELMVQANTPGAADGELAVWIDGKLYLHVVGIRWRDSPEVLLRRFSLEVYVHDARRMNRVWYDDVVVSTGHVGP
jgi:hypothetical protein